MRKPGSVVFLVALCAAASLHAQPYQTPPTWGGDLDSRQRLSGDWGGLRDELGSKGVVLDADFYWLPQKVTSGGLESEGEAWGNTVLTLNLDTQKMGLWPGGFLNVQTVTSSGHNVYRDAGAILPANEAWMMPGLEPETGLQSLRFMQFLSTKFGLVAGKLNLAESSHEFYGDYRTGFSNAAINLPMALALVPLSAYGGGALYLPSENLTVALMAVDPDGTILGDDPGDAFDHGTMVLASADLKINPGGLAGHQNLTLAWSNKDRTSLIQDPSNISRLLLTTRFPRLGDPGPILERILERFAPGLLVPTQPLNQEKDTWAAVYGLEQYVWQAGSDPKRGVGMFLNLGASDGEANPVKHSYSLGLVAKGVVPCRPHDTFGVAWARTDFSNHFVPFLRDTFDLGLDHEDVFEAYYSAALTPWLNISPNLQLINSGLDRTLDPSGNTLKDLDTTYIAGVRVGIRF